jgi:hypothetical protein
MRYNEIKDLVNMLPAHKIEKIFNEIWFKTTGLKDSNIMKSLEEKREFIIINTIEEEREVLDEKI